MVEVWEGLIDLYFFNKNVGFIIISTTWLSIYIYYIFKIVVILFFYRLYFNKMHFLLVDLPKDLA